MLLLWWFDHFLYSRAEICQIFHWFFGKSMTTKRHSGINWPLGTDLEYLPFFSELPLTSVEFASDGTNLVLGTSQGLVYLYDLRYFSTPKAVIDTNSKSPITSVLFQPGGDRSNISALLSSLNKASSIISSNSTQ